MSARQLLNTTYAFLVSRKGAEWTEETLNEATGAVEASGDSDADARRAAREAAENWQGMQVLSQLASLPRAVRG